MSRTTIDRITTALAIGAVAILLSPTRAVADQGGFTNSGGSLGGGTTTNTPPGTLTIAGGTLTFASNDGTTTISATMTTSSTVESCSGGGKGGHITCYFTFTGTFSGTLTVNGSTEAINGSTYQVYGTNGVALRGSTGYNSAYTPFYFSNSGQILRSDDLNGTNLISYGTQGSDVGQFYGAYGIALDAAGRIYIADTYNGRIVRIDDMTGANWTEFGTYGSDVGQFLDPQGVSVDAAGRIYVMDTGNNRLVRIDDMTGANWTEFSSVGSGDGQLSSFVAPVAFDSSGRLYIADGGNNRIVRMDDMTGANWTTLTQSPVIGIYIYSLSSPIGVALDGSDRIYVSNANPTTVVRVDDMTGVNWTSIGLLSGATPHSIAVDASGMVLVGGGGAQVVDNMTGVLASSSQLTQFYGPYYVFGATPVPMPTPLPSAISFSPSTLAFSQNIGTVSPAQTITVTNFGGTPLNGLNVSASGSFAQSNDCPAVLNAGSTCTISVTFAPLTTGDAAGALDVTDDSGNMGPEQFVALTGTGTAPAASLSPASLSFSSQVVGTASSARTITLQSTGTGPLTIAGVAASGPFSQTTTCAGTFAPGTSCTIQVTFAPTVVGAAAGAITVTDDAGTQTIALTGSGSAPVTLSSSSISFGSVAVGNTSSARSVTVTNRLKTALGISGLSTGGPFVVSATTCGASLAAGASCTISVQFVPTALNAAAGSLVVTDSALTSPQTVTLTGTGTAPVTVSSSSLSFGTVTVGTTSSARTVTITSRLNSDLTFGGITTSGPFAVSSTTCGATLAAGTSCTVSVVFSPTAKGAASGVLTIADSAATSPQTVTLSGTGR